MREKQIKALSDFALVALALLVCICVNYLAYCSIQPHNINHMTIANSKSSMISTQFTYNALSAEILTGPTNRVPAIPCNAVLHAVTVDYRMLPPCYIQHDHGGHGLCSLVGSGRSGAQPVAWAMNASSTRPAPSFHRRGSTEGRGGLDPYQMEGGGGPSSQSESRGRAVIII